MDFVHFYTKVWGCPVVPIAENKKPLIKWTEYQERMPTEQELEDWFTAPCKAFKHPPWGLAIILKGGLFSVDLDTEEVYQTLKQSGAFKEGSCIYKSAKGYHAIMRATGRLYSIAEHNEGLSQGFQELGIGGDKHLSNVPDTPGRYWIELHDEPITVDFEGWVRKYVGEPKEMSRAGVGRRGDSEWIAILCPWHEWDGKPHKPSCNVDIIGRGFKCWGCDRQGKLSELVAYCKEIDYPLPKEILKADEAYRRPLMIQTQDKILYEVGEEVTEEELPEALIKAVAWRGDVGELYGVPGSGKSRLMPSGAANLMQGGAFWGDWEVIRPLRLLYLDLENPPGETRMAIQAALGKGEEIPKGSLVAELTGRGFDISNPKWQQWLDEQLTKYQFDVVIGDNLGKMTGKNIIDDYEMKQVVNIIRSLVRKHNILFLLVHHTGWQRYDNQGRPLPAHGKGGSSLQEDVNFCFEVTKTSKYITRITVKKIRSRRAGITTGDEFIHFYDRKAMRIVPATLRKAVQQIRWLVDKYGIQGVADKLGCNRSSISRYMHGYREPEDTIKVRLEEITKAEGYVPRLTDIV